MRLFLLALFSCCSSLLPAQTGSWTIRLNHKTLLSTKTEDPRKNTVAVRSTDWNKKGQLDILFNEDNKSDWYRSFLFYNDADEELLRKDSSSRISISLSQLRKLFAGKKEIIIYTTIAPRDPNLAIRIRRVHLCTLQLP